MIFFVIKMKRNTLRNAITIALIVNMSAKGFIFIFNFIKYGRGYA